MNRTKKQYRATVSRKACFTIAKACIDSGSLIAAADVLDKLAARVGKVGKRGTWGYYAARFAKALRTGKHAFRVFKSDGNTKLPFVAFSTLPIFTCPGAGECKSYCYSLRAWRYPAAYFRQLQNTLYMLFAREHVASAFERIKHGRTLRLYVDGDIQNVSELSFWFNLLSGRPDVKAYGYSKSWQVFLDYAGAFPSNYALNLSSGSVYGAADRLAMLSLPITRGEFIAVRTAGHYSKDTATRFADKAYHADVRQAARAASGNPRVFSCTGKCGMCAKTAHACGDMDRFKLVTIAIGIH